MSDDTYTMAGPVADDTYSVAAVSSDGAAVGSGGSSLGSAAKSASTTGPARGRANKHAPLANRGAKRQTLKNRFKDSTRGNFNESRQTAIQKAKDAEATMLRKKKEAAMLSAPITSPTGTLQRPHSGVINFRTLDSEGLKSLGDTVISFCTVCGGLVKDGQKAVLGGINDDSAVRHRACITNGKPMFPRDIEPLEAVPHLRRQAFFKLQVNGRWYDWTFKERKGDQYKWSNVSSDEDGNVLLELDYDPKGILGAVRKCPRKAQMSDFEARTREDTVEFKLYEGVRYSVYRKMFVQAIAHFQLIKYQLQHDLFVSWVYDPHKSCIAAMKAEMEVSPYEPEPEPEKPEPKKPLEARTSNKQQQQQQHPHIVHRIDSVEVNGDTYATAQLKVFRKEKSLTGDHKKRVQLVSHKIAMPPPVPTKQISLSDMDIGESEDSPYGMDTVDMDGMYGLATEPDSQGISANAGSKRPTTMFVKPEPKNKTKIQLAGFGGVHEADTDGTGLEQVDLASVDTPTTPKSFDINTGAIIGTIDPKREIDESQWKKDQAALRKQSLEWSKLKLRQVEKRKSFGVEGALHPSDEPEEE